jgi:hypothetical protein
MTSHRVGRQAGLEERREAYARARPGLRLGRRGPGEHIAEPLSAEPASRGNGDADSAHQSRSRSPPSGDVLSARWRLPMQTPLPFGETNRRYVIRAAQQLTL